MFVCTLTFRQSLTLTDWILRFEPMFYLLCVSPSNSFFSSSHRTSDIKLGTSDIKLASSFIIWHHRIPWYFAEPPALFSEPWGFQCFAGQVLPVNVCTSVWALSLWLWKPKKTHDTKNIYTIICARWVMVFRLTHCALPICWLRLVIWLSVLWVWKLHQLTSDIRSVNICCTASDIWHLEWCLALGAVTIMFHKALINSRAARKQFSEKTPRLLAL